MRHSLPPGIFGGLAVFALLFGPASEATAAPREWQVVPEESTVSFLYRESGVDQVGAFDDFRGSGTLDSDDPRSARLEIAVESRSISLGSGLVDAFATSAEWFDSANHPLITYRLARLVPQDGERYLSIGTLSIRGIDRVIEAPLTLEIGSDIAHATGELKLERRDYGLGVGPSAAFVEIGQNVSVRFELTARPVN